MNNVYVVYARVADASEIEICRHKDVELANKAFRDMSVYFRELNAEGVMTDDYFIRLAVEG